MPYRNQSMLRRAINRLYETAMRNKDAYPALAEEEEEITSESTVGEE